MNIRRKNFGLCIAILVFICSCKQIDSDKIEYYDNGEKYKKTEYFEDGSLKVDYFLKDGTKEAEGKIIGDVESLIVYYKNGEIYERGKFKNDQRIGWHNFYNEDGSRMNDVFFVNGKVYQFKNYLNNVFIDMGNSVYVEIILSSDTLNQNEEVGATLKYFSGKSQYQFIAAYLSDEIKFDFSNIDGVNKETYFLEKKEDSITFKVEFKDKGKNYIRGYILDAVSDSTDIYELNGVKVLFEKEIYVK